MPIDFLNRARAGGGSSFYDFTLGSLPAGVSFTRASTAWRFNSSGVLVPEATDVPRFQYDPATLASRGLLIEWPRANSLRNATMLGASAGTPGVIPTNWAITADGSGISRAIAGPSVEDGIECVDLRVSGTPLSTFTYSMVFEAATQIVAAATQVWVSSFCARLMAGSMTNVVVQNEVVERTSVGVIVAGSVASITPTNSALKTQYYSLTRTLTDGTTARITNNVRLNLTTGLPVDITLRIGVPQLAWTPAVATPIKTAGSAVAAAADMAFLTNPQVLADQCYVVRGRTPTILSGGSASIVLSVDDGTYNNRRVIYYSSTGRLKVLVVAGGVTQADLDLGAFANDTDFVVAVRFADSNYAASLNGGAIVTIASGSNPLGLTVARIGRDVAGASTWGSTIRSIETRRTATDAELPLLAA